MSWVLLRGGRAARVEDRKERNGLFVTSECAAANNNNADGGQHESQRDEDRRANAGCDGWDEGREQNERDANNGYCAARSLRHQLEFIASTISSGKSIG